MRCAWKELMGILPIKYRSSMDKSAEQSAQELRMIAGYPATVKIGQAQKPLGITVTMDDLLYVINTASQYSPWTAQSIAKGYLTAPGGHRIGICGQAVMERGTVTGITGLTSLCIRIARDYPGIADKIPTDCGSVLIIGPPGAGKTTLLRDLIRRCRETVCVVDEKNEIFPHHKTGSVFSAGPHVHILSGTPKAQGIEMVLRNMGPQTIVVDEITAQEDCKALSNAAWCGVRLIATAHAESKEGLYRRRVYAPLMETGLFDVLIILRKDQSWCLERVDK